MQWTALRTMRTLMVSMLLGLTVASTPALPVSAQPDASKPMRVVRTVPVGWDEDMRQCTRSVITGETLTRCNRLHPIRSYPTCTRVELYYAPDYARFDLVSSNCPGS